MLAGAPAGVEPRGDFVDRLKKTAMPLPRKLVGREVANMKRKIEAIVEAGGYHPKND